MQNNLLNVMVEDYMYNILCTRKPSQYGDKPISAKDGRIDVLCGSRVITRWVKIGLSCVRESKKFIAKLNRSWSIFFVHLGLFRVIVRLVIISGGEEEWIYMINYVIKKLSIVDDKKEKNKQNLFWF